LILALHRIIASSPAEVSAVLFSHEHGQLAGSFGVGSTNLNAAGLHIQMRPWPEMQVLARAYGVMAPGLIEIRQPGENCRQVS
jgi:hypothetical protein